MLKGCEGVSRTLFSVRERESPAGSSLRFRWCLEFPTGAAQRNAVWSVVCDVSGTLRCNESLPMLWRIAASVYDADSICKSGHGRETGWYRGYYSSHVFIAHGALSFARISRVRRCTRCTSCLHVSAYCASYDEQRERGIRSIPSLLMQEIN